MAPISQRNIENNDDDDRFANNNIYANQGRTTSSFVEKMTEGILNSLLPVHL